MTIIIENVDIDELNGQRMELISQIWDDKDSRLWGLVNMLDYVVDKYQEAL